jgi:hypothetical protein
MTKITNQMDLVKTKCKQKTEHNNKIYRKLQVQKIYEKGMK